MISFEDIRPQLKKFVQEGCETADYIMRVSKTPKDGIYAYEELGEIVRCRDCKHYAPVKMADGTEEHRCSGVMAFIKCKPETFCAWAVRRTEARDD